jgi:hypothetical protein
MENINRLSQLINNLSRENQILVLKKILIERFTRDERYQIIMGTNILPDR